MLIILPLKMKNFILLFAAMFFIIAVYAQETAPLSTDNWLNDATTITFSTPDERKSWKNSFNGLRLIFEPQLGTVMQNEEDSFEVQNFEALERIGLETNIYKGAIALQGLFFYSSEVQLAEENTLRANNWLNDPSGRVNVDYGVALGFSLFDGVVAVGYGSLFYDQRDFRGDFSQRYNPKLSNGFWYINIQTISFVKTTIKNLGKR
jgi:hypothetical protein